MYYNNKFGFYIKQYGTHIVVGIVCLIIVLSGLFIHFKINNNTQVSSANIEGNVEANAQENITVDETILSEELKSLETGEKATVKVASVDNSGNLVILSGDKRINAKLIGADFSEVMPDTYYFMNQDLEGSYVDISFDEVKVANGYAMVYVYTDETSLYNAKIIEEGKLVLDSTMSKKSLEYNNLAESQAFAKQTLAGVWGE